MEGERLREAIIGVFSDAQVGLHHHQKLRKSLKKVYDEGKTESEFLEVLVGLLKHAFVVFKREPAVDRLIKFAGYFVANSKEEFVLKFLQETLTPFHTARDKAVRFRVSQLANKILEHMSDGVELNNELYRIIYKAAMVLAFDKVYQIRVQGILLLGSIQDIEDDDCPVVAAMLDRMQKDNNHEVRKCSLQNVAGTLVSLPYILERTRDVKDTVRKAAYSVLAKKFLIQVLSISKRIQILKDGLNDTSPSVKDACITLLMSWLSSFDGDILELVERLDVEGSPDVTQMALEVVFKVIGSEELVAGVCTLMHDQDETTVESKTEDDNTPDNADTVENKAATADKQLSNVVAYNFLTSSVAFFWSSLCSYYNGLGEKGEELLSKITPTPFEFATYLKGFFHGYLFPAKDEGNIHELLSAAQHLVSLTEVLDLSDEFGRQKLAEFYCHTLLLPECTFELAAVIVEHMFCLWPQESYIEKLVGVISEIRQPMESVNPSLDEPVEPITPVVGPDLTINNTLSTDTNTLEDPKVLQKCLVIAHKLYSKLKIQKLGPALLTLLDTLVLPCVQNEEPAIRNSAFLCLGSASLLDINQAQKYLHLLLQVSQIDHEMIQATALKMVFDMLLLYGIDTFKTAAVSGSTDGPRSEQSEDDDVMTVHSFADEASDSGQDGIDQTTQILLKILVEFLGNESVTLREIAGEGLAKLLHCDRVLSQRILARLLLIWFNPVTEDNILLRSLLGIFFPAFAASDRAHAECFCEVYVPVLSTVLEAPETSPLAAVDANNMSDFLLSITTPKPPSETGHNALAVSVCHKVVGCCEAEAPVDVYCRALSRMILTKDDESSLISLHVLLSEVKKNVTGRQNLKYLEKFSITLSKLCPPPPDVAESSSPSILNPAPTPANSHTPAITSQPTKSTRTGRRTKGKTAADKENIPQSEKLLKSTSKAARSKRTAKVPAVNDDTIHKEQAQDELTGSRSGVKSRLGFEDDAEISSDDSYLEHDSPFVKHTKSRTSGSKKQQPLLSSEDDT